MFGHIAILLPINFISYKYLNKENNYDLNGMVIIKIEVQIVTGG